MKSNLPGAKAITVGGLVFNTKWKDQYRISEKGMLNYEDNKVLPKDVVKGAAFVL
jgi:hypothetical protein